MKVVTRFAPSPTGFVHVGAIRTALFAYLLAKNQNGKFIFRIEDTDKNREVVGAEDHIKKSLSWLGLNWDEGIDIGGPHTPYKQSERLIIYTEWAKKLLEQGKAYVDPYTNAELDNFRQQAIKNKQPFLYRNHRPDKTEPWDGTKAVRLKSEPKQYGWHDEVLGDLQAGPEAIDDFILIKADGYPTYNFCHIIDDYLMEVTHVIRSQEFISSVPRFLNLYDALGFKWPKFATLPYVMAIDGHKKLSKRDGAKDILQYAQDGYLPETMLNFLASLGWNDGTEQEIFSRQELIDKFDISHVQKSPARFDEKRLLWMNGQWIRRLSINELAERVINLWPKEAFKYDDEYRHKVLSLVHERLKTLTDLIDLSQYFFVEPNIDLSLINGHKQLSKLTQEELLAILNQALNALNDIDFNPDNIQATLNDLLIKTNQKPVVVFSLIRLATTWAPFSPDLAPSLSLIGKERVLKRLKTASEFIASN
jgi:glutamyl-tRNA synthetase